MRMKLKFRYCNKKSNKVNDKKKKNQQQTKESLFWIQSYSAPCIHDLFVLRVCDLLSCLFVFLDLPVS